MTEVTSTVDIQDPLPESNWLWRRVFSFLLLTALMGALWKTTDDLAATALLSPVEGIGALLSVSRGLLWFGWAVVTYYLIAPSAEQVVKMFKTAALLRHGVQMASRSVEVPGRTEIAQTVGKPPQPEAPAVPAIETPAPVNEETPAEEPAPGKKETEILE